MTVCAVSQLSVVNVSVVLSSVTSVLAWPEMVTVTSPVGSVASLTEYLLVRPVTTLSAVGSIVTAGVSFSVMLTSRFGTVVEA